MGRLRPGKARAPMRRDERRFGRRGTLASSAAALVLASCNLAPHYTPPKLTGPTPATFKQSNLWTPAVPDAEEVRGYWGTPFRNPTLKSLEQEVVTANPTVVAAVASYDQSRAYA